MTTLPSNLTEYKISEIPNVHILGRNVKNASQSGNPVSLFWGASGIEINVKAREVWAQVEVDYDYLEIWLCVLINGRIVSRFMAEKGKNWICLARGFSGETENKICLMRDSQATTEIDNIEKSQTVRVHSFAFDAAPNAMADGETKSAPNAMTYDKTESPKLKIEFIGDSITSGEGLCGSVNDMEWIQAWISPSKNYAVQAAQKLNADFSLISQCGWGIVTSWDNNENCIIPPYYEKACAMCEPWNPDFIFVNLGTNDNSGFASLTPDGSILEKDGLKTSDGVKSFLKTIRRINPNAKICWLWGMLDIPKIVPYLEKGVEDYIAETGDKNVFKMSLPSMSFEKTDDDKGSRGHPGLLTHKNAAEKIIEFVSKRFS